jgi:hypothetical protein
LVVEERGGAHRKASLWWRGSEAGKRQWQAGVGVTGGVRAVGEDVLGGAVIGVGSRRLEDGWNGLSVVAQFDRRGTAVVEQRSSRGRRQGGRRSSRCRCGAWGVDGEFRGGPGWRFAVAQRWWHNGTVAAKGRRRKKAAHGEGCSFYSRRRRLANGGVRLWAARAAAKPLAAEQWWSRSEHGWHGQHRCSDRVADVWGPCGFVFS